MTLAGALPLSHQWRPLEQSSLTLAEELSPQLLCGALDSEFRYSRLWNKRKGMLIDFWKFLEKKNDRNAYLDWRKIVLKSWCEKF